MHGDVVLDVERKSELSEYRIRLNEARPERTGTAATYCSNAGFQK